MVFLIPIILFFSVAPNADTLKTLPNKNVDFTQGLKRSDSIVPQISIPENEITNMPVNEISSLPATSTPETEQETSKSKDELDSQREIIVAGMPACVLQEGTREDTAEDLFSDYLFMTVDEMLDKSITLYGFVYKDDTFPGNTILISRLMMSCCAADASIVGYHVKVENPDSFSNDEWIEVTAIVDTMEMSIYGGYYDFPILTDGIIIRCDVPPVEDSYVYP